MKSKMKRRMLAIVLCMVIVLSNSSFIFASSESGTPAVETAGTGETAAQTETDTQVTETTPQTLAVSESTPAPTDEPAAPTSVEATPTPTDTPEVTTTPEPTGTPTPEATPTPTDTPEVTTTPEPTDTPETTTTPQPTDAPETTTTPEPTDTPEATPTPTQGPENGTSDTVQPTATPTPTEAPVKSNEAVELKQEFKDSDGNVTSTVKAQIAEGTFAADASEITMEVQTPDTASAEHVKEMIEELLPENHMLGDYIFYDIQFKVNGTVTEPQKPIAITFEGEELSVKDVKRANVFWLDPEDPQVDGDKDQLVEITQKSEMIENLQNSGQSTENIDDYDLSEITLKEDGTSDKIQMEGRTSTIYGCYVEKEVVKELVYEDNSVTITVSADKSGVIPEDAELSVTPIVKTEITDNMSEEEKAQAEEINAQYDLTEEKLQKDSEEDEETMEGFLAYDISFLVNGEEVEPDGDVKVVMDFKNAAIPEGVSENATVEVKHLKEVEAAEDGVIVEDMVEKSTVQTTDKAEVEKVELISDTFSTFTITWTTSGYSITVHYVNEKYQEITSDNVQSENIDITDTSETVISDYRKNIAGYRYDSATIGKPDEESGSTGAQSIYSVRVNDRGALQYKAAFGSNWTTWSSNLGYHVYLVYITSDDNAVIETVDNAEENITLHLFDYSTGGNENSFYDGGNYRNGINYGKELKFLSDADGNKYSNLEEINKWTRSSDVRSGIVQDELRNGFPVLSNYNRSLDYLFSTTPSDYKEVYAQANYLFTKDADGYLIFDSDSNYAQFNTSTQKFTVYSNPYSNRVIGNNNGLKVFYPFDTFSEIADTYISRGGQSYGDNGNGGWGLGANQANHYFGMTMSAAFYQPENGEINGNDMVFEFSGDDDVWVFIDNQLVLDLGGIHDRASGSINFATGDVSINDTVRFNMYSGYNSVFNGKFDDYSTHTINFFYLERGNNASNCKLTFNLPTIPENSVMVTKQVTGDDGTALDYAKDVDFQFVITKNEEAVANTTYEIRNSSNQVVGTDTTDSNGHFTLKHGQSAIFEGFLATDKYEVKEIGASLGNGYNITIDGTLVQIKDEEGDIVETLQSASTGEREVSDNPSAVFRNSIKDTGDLKIEKKIKSGSEGSLNGKSFDVRVWINGQLYKGNYSIDGNSQPATNGIISLTGDQVATIRGLPYGAKIVVEEVSGSGYYPEYSITGSYADAVVPKYDSNGWIIEGDVNNASCTVAGDVTVHIENRMVAGGSTSVTVEKKWDTNISKDDQKEVTVTLYSGEEGKGEPVVRHDNPMTLNEGNNWTGTWGNLPGDTNYYVVESVNEFEYEVSYDYDYIINSGLARYTSCSDTYYPLGSNVSAK